MIYDREGIENRLRTALDLIESFPFASGRTSAYRKLLDELYHIFKAWMYFFPSDRTEGIEYKSIDDPLRPYVVGKKLVEALWQCVNSSLPDFSYHEAQEHLDTLKTYKETHAINKNLIEHIEYAEFLMDIFNKTIDLHVSDYASAVLEMLNPNQTSQEFMKSIDTNLVVVYLIKKKRLSIHGGSYCLNIKAKRKHPSGLSIRELSKAICCLLPGCATRLPIRDYFKRYHKASKLIDDIPVNTSNSISYQKSVNTVRGLSAPQIIEGAQKLKSNLTILPPRMSNIMSYGT